LVELDQPSVIYRETVTYPPWLWSVIALPFVVFVVVFIVGLTNRRLGQAGISTWIALGFLVVLVPLIINFRKLDFIVTADTIEFGFGSWPRKKFDRLDLQECEPYQLTFSNYYGYGVRFGKDGTTAYNTRNGPGIKLTFYGVDRPYVLSLSDPMQVCSMLMNPDRRY
jgi:hypothetical protein